MRKTEGFTLVLGACVVLLAAATAQADDAAHPNVTAWQHDPGSSGCWEIPDNWTDGVPGERTWAFINNGGTAVVHGHDAEAVARTLLLGGDRGGTVDQLGGTMKLYESLWLGRGRGAGVYNLMDGRFSTTNAFIGYGRIGPGTAHQPSRFVQSGGTSEFLGTLNVGSGPWAVLQPADVEPVAYSDAYHVVDWTEVLRPPHGGDLFQLTDGELFARQVRVGYGGRGTFRQTGGSARIDDALYLGGGLPRPVLDKPLVSAESIAVWPYGGGTYHLSAGRLSAGAMYVGDHGRGTFVQTGGSVEVDTVLRLGGSYPYLQNATVDGALDAQVMPIYPLPDIGAYNLVRGTLATGRTEVGVGGRGLFTQYGGIHKTEVLRVGGGLWHRPLGDAEVEAALADAESIAPSCYYDSGAYRLVDGELFTGNTLIGGPGGGTFVQTGGVHKSEGAVWVIGAPRWPIILPASAEAIPAESAPAIWPWPYPGRGTYVMRDGVLGATRLDIGSLYPILRAEPVEAYDATAVPADVAEVNAAPIPYPRPIWPGAMFVQSGGGVDVGTVSVMSGRYLMYGGKLAAENVNLIGGYGYFGPQFSQFGGSVHVAGLLAVGNRLTAAPLTEAVPYPYGGTHTYRLAGGELSAETIRVGGTGRSALVQTGGDLRARRLLVTGWGGRYDVTGGSARVGLVQVGMALSPSEVAVLPVGGSMHVGPNARVAVTDRLVFGHAGRFSSSEGSSIHMDGASFENYSRSSQAVGGLDTLRMTFTASPLSDHLWETYEVAGKDLGFVEAGWFENFVLDTLQLGQDDQAGYLRLVDAFDNQPDFEGAEALYLRHLIIGPGSLLDLNGLNVYYFDLELGDGAEIVNGVAEGWEGGGDFGGAPVPEPATLLIIGAGAALALMRKRGRY